MKFKITFILQIILLTYVSVNAQSCDYCLVPQQCNAKDDQIEGYNAINYIRQINGKIIPLHYSISASTLSGCHLNSLIYDKHECTDDEDKSLLWPPGTYCWTPCCPEMPDAEECRFNKMLEIVNVNQDFYSITISRPLEGNVTYGILNYYDLFPEKFEPFLGFGTIGVAVHFFYIEVSFTTLHMLSDWCTHLHPWASTTSSTSTLSTPPSTTISTTPSTTISTTPSTSSPPSTTTSMHTTTSTSTSTSTILTITATDTPVITTTEASSSDRTVYITIYNTIFIASISIISFYLV